MGSFLSKAQTGLDSTAASRAANFCTKLIEPVTWGDINGDLVPFYEAGDADAFCSCPTTICNRTQFPVFYGLPNSILSVFYNWEIRDLNNNILLSRYNIPMQNQNGTLNTVDWGLVTNLFGQQFPFLRQPVVFPQGNGTFQFLESFQNANNTAVLDTANDPNHKIHRCVINVLSPLNAVLVNRSPISCGTTRVCFTTNYIIPVPNPDMNINIEIDYGLGNFFEPVYNTGDTAPFNGILGCANYQQGITYSPKIRITTPCGTLVKDLPPFTIPPNITVAILSPLEANCINSPLTLSASPSNYGGYLWSNGSTANAINVSGGGTYTVTATQAGCTATASKTINVINDCCQGSIVNGQDLTFTGARLSTLMAQRPSLFTTTAGVVSFNIPNPSTNTIAINGSLTIDRDFRFNANVVRYSPNANLIVEEGYNLDVVGGDHGPCGDMWMGIRLSGVAGTNGNRSRINTSNNARIWGAQAAIAAGNDAIVNLTNTVFDQNRRSVLLSSFQQTPTAVGIKGCTFSCVPRTLLKPYLGQTSEAGIFLIDANNIAIGDFSNSQPNLFTGITTGILNWFSKGVSVYDNRFENIRDYDNRRETASGAAVAANSIGGYTTKYAMEVRTSNGTTPDANSPIKFLNCDKGVSFWNFGGDIGTNRMHNVTTGIEALQVQNGKFVNVKNNYLTAVRFGAHFNGFAGAHYSVTSNKFFLPEPTLCFRIDPICRLMTYGVLAENCIKNEQPNMITDNTTSDGSVGIWQRDVSQPTEIRNNLISFTNRNLPLNLAPNTSGIKADNTTNLSFIENTISGFSGMRGYGIDLYLTKNYEMSCNQIGNISVGLRALGNCEPNSNLSIRENKFGTAGSNMLYGIQVARISPSFGFIGKEVGDDNNAQNNNFEAASYLSNFKTYNLTNVNGNPGAYTTTFYTHPTSDWQTAFNPSQNGSNVVNMAFTETLSDPTANWSNECGVNTNIVLPGGGTINSAEIAEFLAIAQEQTSYPAFSDIGKWLDEKGLYEQLEKDGTLKTLDIALDNFYNTKQNEDIGKLLEAELKEAEIAATDISDETIYMMKLAELDSKIDAIPTTSLYAEKLKLMYKYDKELGTILPENLNLTKKEDINFLSEQCPFLYGPAVYRARSLRGLYEDGIDYDDKLICQSQGFFKREPESVSDEEAPLLSKTDDEGMVELVRNPVADAVVFRYLLPEKTTATAIIYDNLGRKVRQTSFDYHQGLSTIDFQDKATGIYHLRFTASNGFSKTLDFIKY